MCFNPSSLGTPGVRSNQNVGLPLALRRLSKFGKMFKVAGSVKIYSYDPENMEFKLEKTQTLFRTQTTRPMTIGR